MVSTGTIVCSGILVLTGASLFLGGIVKTGVLVLPGFVVAGVLVFAGLGVTGCLVGILAVGIIGAGSSEGITPVSGFSGDFVSFGLMVVPVS